MIKKIFGYFFSILFVPLLLPTYATLYIILANPYSYSDPYQNYLLVLRVFLNTFFFPVLTIILMAALKFIKSVSLFDRQERVVPYVASGMFYIWAYYVFYREQMNPYITFILLGCTISIFLDFLVNILVMKISMHASGAGGLVATILLLAPYMYYNPVFVFLVVILIAGCIGAARLALEAHTPGELYAGYLTGFLSFMLAFFILHI